VNVGSAKDKQVLGVLDEVSHELSIRGNSFAINSLLPNIYNIGQKQ
jgi:hypothetical protein